MSGQSHSDHKARFGQIPALRWALILTAIFFVIETAAGFLANSLALLSDAGHMLSDILALGVSLYAAYMTNKAPTTQKSYGYYRTEVLAALFNGIALALVVGFIFYEGLHRLMEPSAVNGSSVILVGSAGLIVNLICAWMLHGDHDLNVRGAYFHVLTDALGSVGALISGILIYLTHWYPFDPLLSFLIGGLVLYSSWSLIRESVDILMESVPGHLTMDEIRDRVRNCEGVESVHDLHIWSIGSRSHSLSAHIKVCPQNDPIEVRNQVEKLLRTEFHLDHTTLQVEVQEECVEPHK